MNSPHAVKNTGLSIQYGSDTHNLLHGDKNTEDHDESQIPNDLMAVNIPSSQCEPTPKDGGDDSNIPRSEKEALIADSEHTTVPLRTYLALDDAMTKIGFGLFQWHVVIICGCILGADAMEIVLLSFILPLLRAEFLLDSVQLSILTGLVFAGMAVGATMFGTISDNFGRRTSFIASSIIVSVSGLISCLSINAFMFACCRFFTGLGLGGTHVAFSLVTEVLPVNRRGSLTGMQSFWVLAIIFQCCVAWLLESQNSWRALAFVSACPGAIATLCMFTLSESPRILLQQGRSAEALQVLQRAARWNRVPPLPDDIQLILDSKDQEKDDCISLETPPTQIREPHEEGNTSPQNREPETSHMLQDSHSHPEETTHTSGAARRPEQRGSENVDVKEPSKWRLLLLFSGKMLRLTPPLLVLWFVISSLYYGIIMMSDGLFTSQNLYITNLFGALIEGPAYIINILVIRLVGRINCMKISMSITLISLLCMWGWQSNKIFVFTMALIIRFSASSTFAVICVYTPEALPTNIRCTGLGLCSLMARIAGILTQFVAIAILETNPSASILIYTFLAFFGLISAFALPFDTSNRELSDN